MHDIDITASPAERRLIQTFRQLPPAERAAVLQVARNLADQGTDELAEARMVAVEALEAVDSARALLASLLERQR